MASQRITIAKIGGASALALASQFKKWAGERTIDEPADLRPDQWPVSARREMAAFASELRANGHAPPVVYYCEYIDLWSMGDLFDRWMPNHNGSRLMCLLSDVVELRCYALPDGGLLAEDLQRLLKKRSLRERDPQEDRWFVVSLLEATLAWTGVVDTAALVVVREVLGGLVEDSEIAESLENTAPWIAACRTSSP